MINLVRGTSIRIDRGYIKALVCGIGYCYEEAIDEAVTDILDIIKSLNY